MLQIMQLQLSDTVALEPTSGINQLLPADAVEPQAEFSDLLLRSARSSESGELLPQAGNNLPLLPGTSIELDVELAVDEVMVDEVVVDGRDMMPERELQLDPRSVVVDAELHEISVALEPPAADPEATTLGPLPLPPLREITLDIEPMGGKGPGQVVPPQAAPENSLSMPASSSRLPPELEPIVAANAAAPLMPRDVAADRSPLAPAFQNRILRPTGTSAVGRDARPAVGHAPATHLRAEFLDSARAELTAASTPPQAVPPGSEPPRQLSDAIGQIIAQNVDAGSQANTGAAGNLGNIGDAGAASRFAGEAPQSRLAQLAAQTIDLPVQEQGWDKVVSERVVLMANGRLQNAEIRLTPADLGPLRVQLAIEDGAASVNFQAQHALTRDAIEQALPRLREMLADSGLTLEQTNVSDDGVAERGRDNDREATSASATARDEVPADQPLDDMKRARVENGLVDTFV